MKFCTIAPQVNAYRLTLSGFYRAMLRRAGSCYGKSSVCLSLCPSVCLSVTLRYRGHIRWNTSKISSRLISAGCLLSVTPTSRIYSKGNTPNFIRNRSGIWKIGLSLHLYADDCQVYLSTTVNDAPTSVDRFARCIEDLV